MFMYHEVPFTSNSLRDKCALMLTYEHLGVQQLYVLLNEIFRVFDGVAYLEPFTVFWCIKAFIFAKKMH